MFLLFPYLHMELIKKKPPFEFFLLNPGLKKDLKGYWIPPNLPFKGKQAQKLFNEALRFVNLHKDPRDLSSWLDWEILKDEEPKSYEIRTELINLLEEKKTSDKLNMTVQSQFMLFLYWIFEDKVLEIEKIRKEIAEKQKSLYSIIGIENNVVENNVIDGFKEHLPWNKILPYFLFFVGKNKILIVDELIFKEWKDSGIKFKKIDDLWFANVKGNVLVRNKNLKGEVFEKTYKIYFWG